MTYRDDIKRLAEEKANVWRGMDARLEESRSRAIDGVFLLTAEEQEAHNRQEARIQDINRTIETLQASERLSRELAEPQGVATPVTADVASDPEAQYRDAFFKYFKSRRPSPDLYEVLERGMDKSLTNDERREMRDMGVATGGAGGFMVPQGFYEHITRVMAYWGPMRDLATVIQTSSGNDMPWPTNDDTANVGAILAENTVISALDTALTSKTLKSWVYTSNLVKVSWQWLNDSAFPVQSFLGDILGDRLGRIQNTHFTKGNGTTQPEGIITNAQANSPKVVMASGTTAGFGVGAAALTNGFAGLMNTLHAINPAYRRMGGLAWQMHDSVVAATRLLSDTSGRPIWIPAGIYSGIAGTDPDTLLGAPVYINSDMDTFGATKVVAMIGNWKRYYIIRDVLGISMMRLDERYADQLQAGFFSYCRTDGRVDDVKAAACLVTNAT